MSLFGLTSFLSNLSSIKATVLGLKEGKSLILEGLTGTAKAAYLASIIEKLQKNALIITYSYEESVRIAKEVRSFLKTPEKVLHFPAPDTIPFENVSPSKDVVSQRLNVLDNWLSGKEQIVVAPIKAVMQKVMPVDVFKNSRALLKTGENTDREELFKKLDGMGYKRMEIVGEIGEWSVRGAIVDIFSSSYVHPVRIEFIGSEIESIRLFDILSQRSISKIEEALILPVREVVITGSVKNAVSKLHGEDQNLEKILNGEYFEGIESYLPIMFAQSSSPIDYLPKETLIVFDEPVQLSLASDYLVDEAEKERKEKQTINSTMANCEAYIKFDEIKKIKMQSLELSTIGISKKSAIFSGAKPSASYLRRIDMMISNLKMESKENKIIIASRQALRLKDIFEENNTQVNFVKDLKAEPEKGISIVSADLSQGFEIPELNFKLFSDSEIFGEKILKGEFKVVAQEGVDRSLLIELNEGNYVVHANHGIGVYRGLHKLNFDNVEQEYLLIEYAQGDKLYVPLSQMGLVSRYSAGSDYTPKVSRLGEAAWARTTKNAKKAIEDLTRDLLKLYAIREKEQGFTFPKDDLWQVEFESSFQYEETPDQAVAIKDVKVDMERSKPMDRLICGDVGYGKTEVALRAAFKAVAAGKQVAFLVPTTILAQQHYSTLKERFAPFPFIVESLSRFKSKKEQKAVIEGLAAGSVDVVVGTHRLLQKDIRFRDLGLVIIDEEQRFGVKHKEKLKHLRKMVDVLTLTATPIPRTLYLGISGARDMSTINTPPLDRSSIRTYVLAWNENIIKEAILRELDRNGQIYFVHNTVHDIEKLKNKLRRIVPNARIAVAHGQMDEHLLSETMQNFMQRKYDILLSTTIIESGLDIPNVNTIIIDGAENFGLADLYQLRGRVGRSSAKAYSYLMFHPEKVLTEKAQRRLDAIKEFTALGSGYRLALRDLEIRGAGNILGAQQHGHIAAIGFDLYCQLLEAEVKKLKGKYEVPSQEIIVDLKVDAFIPGDYVSDERQRIAIYRKMSYVSSIEEVNDLKSELKDRFGDIPAPLEKLFKVLLLKADAKKAGIKNIEEQKDFIHIDLYLFNKEKIRKIISLYKDRSSLFANRLSLKVSDLNSEKRFKLVATIAQKLQ